MADVSGGVEDMGRFIMVSSRRNHHSIQSNMLLSIIWTAQMWPNPIQYWTDLLGTAETNSPHLISIYITLISITGWYKTPMSQVMGGPFIIHLSWSNMKDYMPLKSYQKANN